MKAGILILTIFLCTSNALAHNYFFGFAEVEYNDFSQKFEATITLTAHDLEKAFKSQGKNAGDLEVLNEKQSEIVEEYINKHFTITSGGNKCHFSLIGSETDLTGLLHLYFESSTFEITNSIDIHFSVLMEEYEEQQNKVTLYYRNQTYTMSFLQTERNQSITIEKPKE